MQVAYDEAHIGKAFSISSYRESRKPWNQHSNAHGSSIHINSNLMLVVAEMRP